jgi:hypothetical protein
MRQHNDCSDVYGQDREQSHPDWLERLKFRI